MPDEKRMRTRSALARRSSTLLLLGLAAAACGTAPTGSDGTGRTAQEIVNGYRDDADTAVVAIGHGTEVLGFCTGSLITPNLVMTARHCVGPTVNEGPHGGIVCDQTTFGSPQTGAFFFAATDDQHRYRGTGVVHVPPDSAFCGNDIALIQLEGTGVPDDVAKPLVPRLDTAPTSSEQFAAIGYGLTSPSGTQSGVRMRVDENLVRCLGESCNSPTDSIVAGNEWLGDARTCPGDSGGPAVDAKGQVMGVLSRGPDGCIASVYTDVKSWKPLIVQTAIEASQSGGFDPPAWTGVPPKPKLGQSCTGPCAGGYLCLADDPKAPGICVPPCSADAPTCPSGFQCDMALKACSNLKAATSAGNGDGGGCSVRKSPSALGAAGCLGTALGALAWFSRRRRRR